MTRRSLLNILSAKEQSLGDVWNWYEFQRSLIGEEKARVAASMASYEGLSTSRYVGKTREELDADFAYQAAELGQVTMLGMLACAEAALRVDFIEKVSNKRKDPVSRGFWNVYHAQGMEKIRLDEDILDTWRDRGGESRIKRAVAEFKGALGLRHWLAHGRYWKPKLGRANGYDAVDVFDICAELLQSTGLMPADAAVQ